VQAGPFKRRGERAGKSTTMIVVHESLSQLVIHSSGTAAKVLCAIVAGVGSCVCAAAVVGFVMCLSLEIEIELSGLIMLAGGFAAAGALFGVVGVHGMLKAKDADYHFDGQERRLLIQRKSGREEIPFSRIVQAETYLGDGDERAYGLRLELRDWPNAWEISQVLEDDQAPLAALARRINNFLEAHSDAPPASGPLAVDNGAAEKLPPLLAPRPPALDGEAPLFVCPACGWQTNDPLDPPPHECVQCQSIHGQAVLLHDRTPGRAIVVRCGCGDSFSVPLSFAGMMRACPGCGRKCSVPQPPPRAPMLPKRPPQPIDPSAWEEDA
jgi:hypothetical protein